MHSIDRWLNPITARIDLPARILIAIMFLVSGYGKIAGAAAMGGYLAAHGLPGFMIWPAAAWEIVAGTLMVVGFLTRPLSLLLAGWCLLTALIFHTASTTPIR